ncbi:CDP-glycerol--glycerophosphate glycerophosphotransferase [Peribacillus butanolivorans]|uniref:CDP-glycerol--glycerophosphate glycerophosphotransferase n=1 Tax=Peribacillus butanolivorans TaxID=421767 RepID=A0AAX0RQZ6_9BACI|nr:CDP-glycerol--glycerophosphate glycerophosphotransferase [Peribacillus butanolivorans]QNU02737.1 CDP-glycerol glycerophosphotransferase family protein [Peribacillus butanolivorans]
MASIVTNGKAVLTSAYKFIFGIAAKVLPVDKKLVIFESFLGKQYSCNPRAIYEYLQCHHSEYKMYWSVDKRYTAQFDEAGIPYLKRFSLSWLLKMTRARYWVTNSRLPLWIPKPNHTVYLQTWHGTPLKKLASDMKEVHMPGTTTESYKENFHAESSKWDYLISPNAYSSEIFARAFQVEPSKILETGYPRNDLLYNGNNRDTIDSLKRKLGIPLEKKVILYAPTWRDDEFYSKGKYKFEIKLDLDQMKQELGDEYVILLRLHYLISENLDVSAYQGFVYNLSSYEDINHLYLISDLLITDYSSVFFDYANLKRPMLFYVYDIENYRDRLRGFYFDFEAMAPGSLVKTSDAVIDSIKAMEFGNAVGSNQFHEKFCALEDGQASRRVVEKVFLGRSV